MFRGDQSGGRASALPPDFLGFLSKNADLALFCSLFLVYLFSLSPIIYTGDSSLFISASFSLGSAHPPGYPLYIMLGKLLTFLPFGNIAYKVNLLSAIFGALSCLMAFKTAMKLFGEPSGSKAATFAASAISGLVPVFFIESVKAEVYTLNAFISMSVFYLGLKALEEDFFKNALTALFLLGLGMGNHHSIALSGSAVIMAVIIRRRDITPRWLLIAPLVFAIGFSINLLLYIRSLTLLEKGVLVLYSNAYGKWAGLGDILLRKAYASGSTVEALKGALTGAGSWLTGFKNSIRFVVLPAIGPVLPFIIIGIIALIRRPRILGYMMSFLFVWLFVLSRLTLSSETISTDQIQTVSPYFLPIVPVLYCIAAVGFSAIIEFLKRKDLKILPKALPYIVVASPLVILPFTLKESSLSKNYMAYDFSRDMLGTLPQKSLLMNYADNSIFTAFYMRAVERYREDILIIDSKSKEKNIFGLDSSPSWKYSGLYPEFYKTEKSSIKELNRDFALKRKLFASTPIYMTKELVKHYEHFPYLLSIVLYPQGEREKARDATNAQFISNFDKLNYERVMESPYRADLISSELYGLYSFAAIRYGDMLKRRGEISLGEAYRAVAFKISDPWLFVWPYANFLIEEGYQSDALALIEEIGKIEGLEEYTDKLRQAAKSVINSGI